MATKPQQQIFASIWDALEDSPEAAAHMQLRSHLMIDLSEFLRAQGWTQADAAKRCNISQPRVSDLLRGRITKFSLDALVDIATALGLRVDIRLVDAQPRKVRASGK